MRGSQRERHPQKVKTVWNPLSLLLDVIKTIGPLESIQTDLIWNNLNGYSQSIQLLTKSEVKSHCNQAIKESDSRRS